MGINEPHPHFVIVTPTTTPHSIVGSKELNDQTTTFGLAQYVQNKVWQRF
jgi:hypothetical protein